MRSALAVCLLALALPGCGATARDSAKDFSGPERDVAATIEDVEDAARTNDADRLCAKLLSDRLLATLKEQGTNCKTAVKEAFKDASSKDLTVDDISISGATATAKVTSGSGSKSKQDTLELEKVGSGWKISSLRS